MYILNEYLTNRQAQGIALSSATLLVHYYSPHSTILTILVILRTVVYLSKYGHMTHVLFTQWVLSVCLPLTI